MLATAVDLLSVLEFRYRQVHYEKPHRAPQFIPRPGEPAGNSQVAVIANPTADMHTERRSPGELLAAAFAF